MKRQSTVRITPEVWEEFKDICNDLGYRKTNEVIEALIIAFNRGEVRPKITVEKKSSIKVEFDNQYS